MDEIDHAQAREQNDRELALLAMRERINASLTRDPSIDGLCVDCDQPIEPKRIKAMHGCCTRCIECERRHEHRLRGYRA